MDIIGDHAGCAGVMGITDGAGAADGGDGHQASGVGRDDDAMGIVRLSPKPSGEVSR